MQTQHNSFVCPVCRSRRPRSEMSMRSNTPICQGCDDFQQEQAGLGRFNMRVSIEQTKIELKVESED
jgi:hypothetical protein